MSQQDIPVKQNNLTIEAGSFRFWQDYTPNEAMQLIERTPLGNYLIYGRVEEAFQNGLDIVDDEDNIIVEFNEVVQNSDQFQKHDANRIKLAIANMEGYGWAYLTWSKLKATEEDFFIWTTGALQDNTSVLFAIKDDLTIESAKMTLKTMGKDFEETFETSDQLANGMLLIRNRADPYEGRSYLHPIFDALFSYSHFKEQIVRYITRVGSGIHQILIDESLFGSDPEAVKLFDDLILKLNSMSYNTKLFMPATINGTKTEYKLYTGEGSPPNFEQVGNEILLDISIYTGIPLEKLKGNPTAFASSDNHQSNYFSALEQLQEKSKAVWKFALSKRFPEEVEKLTTTEPNEKGEEIETKSDFHVKFRARKQLTEKEELEVLQIKADIIDKLRGKIADEELSKEVGFTIQKIEPLVMTGDTPDQDDADDEDQEPETKPKDEDN